MCSVDAHDMTTDVGVRILFYIHMCVGCGLASLKRPSGFWTMIVPSIPNSSITQATFIH